MINLWCCSMLNFCCILTSLAGGGGGRRWARHSSGGGSYFWHSQESRFHLKSKIYLQKWFHNSNWSFANRDVLQEPNNRIGLVRGGGWGFCLDNLLSAKKEGNKSLFWGVPLTFRSKSLYPKQIVDPHRTWGEFQMGFASHPLILFRCKCETW